MRISKRKWFPHVFTIIVLLLTLSCSSNKLKVQDHPAIIRHSLTPASSILPVSFSIIQTGTASTQEAFVYKGGGLFRNKELSHVAVWVKHPKGDFLFDTGLGDSIDIQHQEMAWLHQQLFSYKKEKSVKAQLLEAGINPDTIKTIILSHLHWDHASGIKDFPKAKVLTSNEELDFAQRPDAESPAFLKSQYDGTLIEWVSLEFDSIPYEHFEESLDYFGDGSVLFVKLPGHSKGSIGMFLIKPSGERFFFTGDVTWDMMGFKKPATKHAIPSNYVDFHQDELAKTIVDIHQLMLIDTTLKIIPAHDLQSQASLKHFPEFQ